MQSCTPATGTLLSEPTLPASIATLIDALDSHGDALTEPAIRSILTRCTVSVDDVAPYVRPRKSAYNRHPLRRTEHYELLVLTWLPGQASPAHDHAGSLCGLKVLAGSLTEQHYTPRPDGHVEPTSSTRLSLNGITVDPGVIIHSLGNASETDLLVTLHIYAKPLPELRRYTIASAPPAPLFTRSRHPRARHITILGGGFTGAITFAQLLRQAAASPCSEPLHLTLIDRQPSLGEGIAYRTDDARHLLNVPAGRMSAFPDAPDDFLNFARSLNPNTQPTDFLPRKLYAQYLRHTLQTLTHAAPQHLTAEILRAEATALTPLCNASPDSAEFAPQGREPQTTAEASCHGRPARANREAKHPAATPSTSSPSSPPPGWQISTPSRTLTADTVILALGHRPPDDVFARRWSGPRQRFIANPWASLTLSQIRPDEPVLLLGSGLTAVDALLTLDHPDRTAPIHVLSRRGVMPLPHLPAPKHPVDIQPLLAAWLDPHPPHTPLTVRTLVRDLRRQTAASARAGHDWRQVIDALRPHIPALWDRLSVSERGRFLHHVRPFWEIHRHRTAPEVATRIQQLRDARILRLYAGNLLSAAADDAAVTITTTRRRSRMPRTFTVAHVINCTGPGIQHRHSTHPLLRPLLEAGTLTDDEFSLGLRTDPQGRALTADGPPIPSLLVTGTLRKPALWESTAVPELRAQAQQAATLALQPAPRPA